MVDFKKRIGKKVIERKTHPCEIYEGLDRASDKGPLRKVQDAVLRDWHDNFSDHRDVILKLHTGQGKTLIGLLILQSRLNEDSGPALYLCPNNYLVEQTCQQAESFGISYVTTDHGLPDEFLESKRILITSASKVFTGVSKSFGLGPKSLHVSTIVLDDSHACIGIIQDSCKIGIKRGQQPYDDLLTLFGPELEKQGLGTYADILHKDYDSFLSVPYWDWRDKRSEVANILSKHRDMIEIRYAWPILKDIIAECQCIISGSSLEITPYVVPLEVFGTYAKAEHRIFMSATLTNDAFFIKGLGVDSKTIENPLCYAMEKWSGEKMILIPAMVDSSLDRGEIVHRFAQPKPGRKFGVVALAPSFKGCRDWEKYGSVVAKTETIADEIEKLKNKECEKTLVIANRYDGIDLPDQSCRILIFDSKPYSESLLDRFIESCRSNSDIISVKIAQTIEQGLGRAVRGEKDYCAILLIGHELINFIQSKATRKYFSNQTRVQISIGFEISEYAMEDIKTGSIEPIDALKGLINQLLKRDDGWKEFYAGNRSGAMHIRLDEGRLWRCCEGGGHDLNEEMKGVSSLKPAGPGDG